MSKHDYIQPDPPPRPELPGGEEFWSQDGARRQGRRTLLWVLLGLLFILLAGVTGLPKAFGPPQ